MKNLAAFAFLLFTHAASAQWINGFSIQPSNPTTNDTITIFANVSFPSGGCEDKSQNHTVVGSQIQANALHCIGMATFICSTTDTFKIEPLPAGTYTFQLQLDAGAAPGPCTPGIVPGPTDTLIFSVTQASSLPEVPEGSSFSIYPVPAINELTVITRDFPEKGTRFEIIDASGRLVFTTSLASSNTTISVAQLSKGNYIARLVQSGKVTDEEKFTVIKEN